MFQKKSQTERAGTPAAPENDMNQTNPNPNQNGPSHEPAAAGASTVLAEGSRFVGKANVSGTFRVEGEAEGDIEAADTIVVGNTGNVQAQVTARRAVVNGRLKGKITAREGVEFQSGSQVEADIKAKNMMMEDGVSFRGNCEIGS